MVANRRTAAGINVIGVLLTVLGALAVLLSFTVFDWYKLGKGADSIGTLDFRDLHRVTSQTGVDIPAFSKAYFGWMAWILLIVVILISLAANMPGAVGTLRGLGLVVGVLGALATYFALDKFFSIHGGTHGVFADAKPGLWAALIGFVLAGAGAVAGRRPAD